MTKKQTAATLALTLLATSLFSVPAMASGTVKFTNSTTINSGYSRTNAANYAVSYAVTPNTSYANYGASALGGDCTNFASQVLKAGGMTMVGYNGTFVNADDYINSWYYRSGDRPERSTSWTGAHEYRYFWGNVNGTGGQHAYQMKTYTIDDASTSFSEIYTDLWPGDIVQYVDSTGTTYHSQIVHRYASGELYVAQHSTNDGTWNKEINLRQSIIDHQYVGGWFVTLKMKSASN